MRPTLLALTFALLPLSNVATAAEQSHTHGSLAPHEHGTAQLSLVLDGQTLALDLDSPAMNLVGFEHAPASEADQAAIANARAQLAAPLELFNLSAAAKCGVTGADLQSPLFGDAAAHADDHEAHEDGDDDHHGHSDVDGHFQFHCDQPEALQALDLSRFFKAFPATHKVVVQAITPNGQAGHEATPDNSKLAF